MSWLLRAFGGGAAQGAGPAQPLPLPPLLPAARAPPGAAHAPAVLDTAPAGGGAGAQSQAGPSPLRAALSLAALRAIPHAAACAAAPSAATPPAAASPAAAPPAVTPGAAPARRALGEQLGAGNSPPRAASPSQLRPHLPLRASPRLAALTTTTARGAAPACGKARAGEARAGEERPSAPRSVEEMRQRRGSDPELPVGMPTGPWAEKAQAHADINAFCMNIKTHGGGFAVVWGSSDRGNATRSWARGDRCMLACHQHALPHSCKWKLWLEECLEGWAIWSFKGHDVCVAHSHTLVQSREEANAHTAMRSIPESLLVTAKSMVRAGLRVAEVSRWLRHEVEKDGDEVAFNYQDVYSATGASTKERMLDATNLVELLRLREQEHGLFYRTTTDGEGCLKNVFFAMAGAHDIYAVDARHQVVEFDTKVRSATQPPRRARPVRRGGARDAAARAARRRRCASQAQRAFRRSVRRRAIRRRGRRPGQAARRRGGAAGQRRGTAARATHARGQTLTVAP
jgi:hypothetical protein